MNVYIKVLLKIAGTICASVIAFCLGFILTGNLYEHWIVPSLVRKHPHDGQIGLAVLFVALVGACILGIVVLVLGIIWTVRTSRLPVLIDPVQSGETWPPSITR